MELVGKAVADDPGLIGAVDRTPGCVRAGYQQLRAMPLPMQP